MDILLTI